MDDNAILDLYFARSEQAISETDRKYGRYCYSIANHILSSPSDAEESVNDTYFAAWKLIPPRRPQRFGPFLGKLTRNLSIDRWRKNTAEKRGGGEMQLLLDELAECVTGAESPETDLLKKELTTSLNRFLRKLAEQYHLKPTGNLLSFRTTRNLCNALGIERFTQAGQALRAEIGGGGCYDSGNFWLDMGFTFPEDQGYEVVYTPGVLRWNRLDSFSRDYVTLVDSGDWVERNYTTAAGSTVLILQSPSQELGYILCDRGEALMSLQLNVNIELLSEDGGVVSAEYQHMTDEQINMVADSIDFTVQPKLPTQADVDAQPEISQEATQDGYTVQLKSVETDGYVVRILLGITAPEGTALPDVEFSNWYSALTPTSGTVSGDGSTNGIMDDGDGKDNTADWLLIDSPTMADGSMPFAPGSTWEAHLVDIVHSGWDSVNNRSYNDTLAEGEWLFPIHFDEQNGDYRELELLSQPVSAKASTCWRMDGTDVTDVLETFRVTSVKVRRMSIKLTSDAGENADFFLFYGASSYAVMKDGSRVEIMNSEFVEPIDLEKLDYILLADGTKLPAPGN